MSRNPAIRAFYSGYFLKRAGLYREKGAEVLIGSRDVRAPGGASVGRHQFLVMVPEHPENFPPYMLRDVGDGRKGIVLGAYNRGVVAGSPLKRELIPDFFDRTDYRATLEALGQKELPGGTLDAILQPVKPPYGYSYDEFIENILNLDKAYRERTAVKPQPYPKLGLGANSNSYIQSLLDYSRVREAPEKMYGFDYGARRRLPPEMFGLRKNLAKKKRTRWETRNVGDVETPVKDFLATWGDIFLHPQDIPYAAVTKAAAEEKATPANIYGGRMPKMKGEVLLGIRHVPESVFKMGWHQFLVLVPEHPENFPSYMLRDVGGGREGIVLGGYRTPHPSLGRPVLKARFHDRRDLQATREGLSEEQKKRAGSRWQAKFHPVTPPKGVSYDAYIRRILNMAGTYQQKTFRDPFYYPKLGIGVNSNSFAQTLLDYSEAGSAPEDMPGKDYGRNLRIPSSLFGLKKPRKRKKTVKLDYREPSSVRFVERAGDVFRDVFNPIGGD